MVLQLIGDSLRRSDKIFKEKKYEKQLAICSV
jgi:hypothetical protein